MAFCDHRLGCLSRGWPGPSSTAQRGPSVVSPPDLSQRIVHAPRQLPTAWMVLKGRHPLDPLQHLLIALLFCKSLFVFLTVIHPSALHFCTDRHTPIIVLADHRHRAVCFLRQHHFYLFTIPTTWLQPCTKVPKPSSNNSSRPNRLSGTTMHISQKSSARISGIGPPLFHQAMYPPTHMRRWLTRHHDRYRRCQT
jgi:hypothetical protein